MDSGMEMQVTSYLTPCGTLLKMNSSEHVLKNEQKEQGFSNCAPTALMHVKTHVTFININTIV